MEESQKMMEKLQKTLIINRFIQLILIVLLVCVLVGGYMVVRIITPAMELIPEMRSSLQNLEQIDYQALNQTINELDVAALNEKIEQLDVENLNEALENLDTEELSEAMENLNNTVDKLEKLEESLSAIGDWFRNKFNF